MLSFQKTLKYMPKHLTALWWPRGATVKFKNKNYKNNENENKIKNENKNKN